MNVPIPLSAGGSTQGSSANSASSIRRRRAQFKMVPVPYRGQGAALADLLSGQVQVYFATTPGMTDFIRSGKLRALAVTTASRAEVLPELATVGEFLPGYEASQWYGIGAPKSTPAEIIDKLNKEINAGLADPKLKVRFADIGGTVLPGSPADFGKLIGEKWRKVIKFAGIKPE
jgi:tripartite-type tricarboxylate transporter receptor subunit TctC